MKPGFHTNTKKMNNLVDMERKVMNMTATRQEAIELLEKLPEDKLIFIIQIMQGVNGLYGDSQTEKQEAFSKLEHLKKKGTVTDYDKELASYRESKYER